MAQNLWIWMPPEIKEYLQEKKNINKRNGCIFIVVKVAICSENVRKNQIMAKEALVIDPRTSEKPQILDKTYGNLIMSFELSRKNHQEDKKNQSWKGSQIRLICMLLLLPRLDDTFNSLPKSLTIPPMYCWIQALLEILWILISEIRLGSQKNQK